MTKNNNIAVTEYKTFNEAWDAAHDTRDSFGYYQNMKQKIDYIKQAQRWFVTTNGKLYYSYMTPDKVRIVKEANPISCLTNNAYQYVQIMVPISGKGTLRVTDQYCEREGAIKESANAEVIAFTR